MNLVDRVKKLMLQPKAEWQVIDGETHTVQGLYTGYVMILAAIPAICGFIGMSMLGGLMGAVGIEHAVVILVVQYLGALASVYILALVIDALAPNFGSTKNFMQAFKIAAFVPTASWIGGVFSIIPVLGIIGLLFALYSLYQLFIALPMLMKTPADKAVIYFVVVLIVAIVVYVVIGTVAALAMPSPVRGF
ncbi:MAG TPA: Yip1 family protein [Usitatibacter sp.]|nr:Yip1 family protein [Usitatibacter sp.]